MNTDTTATDNGEVVDAQFGPAPLWLVLLNGQLTRTLVQAHDSKTAFMRAAAYFEQSVEAPNDADTVGLSVLKAEVVAS